LPKGEKGTSMRHSTLINQYQEIKNLWKMKATNSNSIIELRAIKKQAGQEAEIITKLFKGKNFQSVDELRLAFEQEALSLNAHGYNIYIVMNPINDSFMGSSASDKDVAFRDLLLIDIDRHVTKNPATELELEAARVLADDIAAYLKLGGMDGPINVMSGNGYHLYYILGNIDNSLKSKEFIQNFLKELAIEFDNEIVKVDTSVFNASRITKVVGTVARKGEETSDRPYRMARFL
jgi:hypothetical protein